MNRAVKTDRQRLRAAIIAQLGRQQMTAVELADELDDLTTYNQVRREVLNLVAQGVVCSQSTGKGRHDRFETWERALERVRAKQRGPTVKPRGSRPARHVA